MPFKCSVPGCTTNYDGATKDPNISLYKFPNPETQKELLEIWLRKIPREWSDKDFDSLRNNPNNSYRVCGLHFDRTAFISESCDSHSTRRVQRSPSLSRKRLKPESVPVIFPNTKPYLSGGLTTPRSAKSSAESRREMQAEILDNSIATFLNEDAIDSLTDLKDYNLPTHLNHFMKVFTEEKCSFHQIEDMSGVPFLKTSVVISAGMKVVVIFDGVIKEKFGCDIIGSSLKSYTSLENLLCRLNNLEDSDRDIKHFIHRTLPHISSAISLAELTENNEIFSKLWFLQEQLNLLTKEKSTYSSQLLSLAFLLQNHSPAAYSFLQESDTLTLPSKRHLQRLSSTFSDSPDEESITKYLKLKSSGLSEVERLVILNIDEIHANKKVEYSGGKCFGTEFDSENIAKTVCAFLIKSIVGDLQDVISLIPKSTLNSEDLYQLLVNNLQIIHDAGFNPVLCSVDNNTVNRKLFVSNLCLGDLKTSISNPVSGQPLYLLFDPVHNFKNIFNNWHTKENFQFPDFNNPSETHCADFLKLNDLYEMELGNPSRIAYKLNKRVINPNSLEKTNVSLACSIFDESTLAAARFYDFPPGFQEFLRLILQLWNIWNTRSATKGMHKRLPEASPLQPNDSRLQLLRDYARFFTRWRDSKLPGLTNQTFLAVIHTCHCLADVAEFLFKDHSFSRVLLGRFVSDWIERRFGRYRQFHGGNFFVSVRQIFQAEKKIRVSSLLKHHHFSLSDLKTLSCDVDNIDDNLLCITIPSLSKISCLSSSDRNLIMYIAGYACYSLSNLIKCSACKSILTDNSCEIELICDIQESDIDLLNMRDRGGLKTPSNFTYQLVSIAYFIFTFILENESHRKHLFYSSNVVSNLSQICIESLYNSHLMYAYIEKQCLNGHHLRTLTLRILSPIFNIFLKNFVKEKNDNLCVSALQRKKLKLSSLSSKS